jgi:hypothetical protein
MLPAPEFGEEAHSSSHYRHSLTYPRLEAHSEYLNST